MWAAFYLKEKVFARFELYILYYLKRENIASYDPVIRNVVNTVGYYIYFFSQSFGDLDEARTAELRFLEFVQTASISNYLIKFTQYASRVI
jgi:hypothetical protein